MKKVLFGALALALVAGSFTSCKKGENDPFMSLKSRKGRMAGEYTISNMTMTSTTTSGGTTSTETTTIDGNTITITQSQGGSSTSTTGTVNKAEAVFNKDGSYTMDMDVTFTQEIFGTTTTSNSVTMTEGNWSFLTGDEDFKKKERIVMNTTKETQTETTTSGGSSSSSTDTNTYGNGEVSEVMAIDQLKNKEIIMKTDYASTYSDGTNSSSTTTTSMITLTAK
jgi:hypothetical protein